LPRGKSRDSTADNPRGPTTRSPRNPQSSAWL
jgi:hypothetical protein